MGSKVADSHGVDKARKQSAQAKHAPTGLHAAQPSTPMDHVRVVAKKIMDSNYFSAFMTVLTIYALFGDDMKLTLTDVTADDGFVVAAWICVFFFSFEIMCNIFANPFYLWGFYFWIDLVSTLSILMEIPMVMDPLTGEMGGASGSSAEMAKAGKAGRVGTKASKVIRIVRLVRMVRVVKLYKMHNGADDAMQDTSLEPSSVGKKLTEITTQRLICMMLVMIMALPWLQSGSLLSNNFNFQYHFLKHLHQYPQNFNRTGADGSPLVSEADFRQQVRYYARKSYQDGYPLLYLEICEPQTETGVYGGPYSWANCNTTWTHDAIHDMVSSDSNEWGSFMERPDKGIGMNGFEGADKRGESVIDKLNYRDSASGEFFQITQVGCYRASGEDDLYGGIKNWEPAGGKMPGEGEHHKAWDIRVEQPTCISFAIFSNREKMRLLSGMSLLKTLFIMIMIVGGSLAFNHDAQIFVIGPIERMMTLVKRLAENPLDSASISAATMLEDDKKIQDQGYETVLLEQTLERVGQLLQVGFGAAGAEIIGKNMKTGTGKLNAMVPGKKITAIYGFCDIRQFTDTTECLQEEVMVYVNKLGNLVHTATHTYFGMANKNVGDAFLLSWKVCDGEMDGFTNFSDTATEAQRVKANETIRCVATNSALRAKKRQITPSQMADAAITAFLKCQIDLFNENVDGCLTCYATYEAVIRRFGPGFSIKMGFGMHVGWAIEGAIGSELKIDATYLSPHVEMSDRLEASSKIFLAKLNVSHWLHNLASPGLKKYTRPIAYIRAEGVTCPFTVWTYDVMYNKIGFGKPTSTINPKTKKQDLTDWTHPEYTEIQEGLHPEFIETWLKAYSAFVEGDWPAARRTFDAGMRLKPDDGPTLYLLGFMDANNDTLPENWDGAHFLDGF